MVMTLSKIRVSTPLVRPALHLEGAGIAKELEQCNGHERKVEDAAVRLRRHLRVAAPMVAP